MPIRCKRSIIVLSLGLLVQMSIPAAAASLYDDLGQRAGIDRIAAALVARAHSDPRIKDYFDGVSDKRLTEKLAEQFCNLADGPCEYTGRSMQRAHAGLHITQAAFNALVEDLQDVMDEAHVPNSAQNRLLAQIAPMIHEVDGQ